MMRAEWLQRSLVLALALLLGHPLVHAWRSFRVILERIDFEANDKLIDLKIDLLNGNKTRVNAVLKTLQVFDNVEVSGGIALEAEPGNYTTLVTRTMNLCQLLKDHNSNPLAWTIFQDMMRHGKLFKQCPVQKDTYTLVDFAVDEELLPSFLPETSFKITMRLTQSKTEQIFKGNFYGRIDKSKGFNNLKMFSMG